VTPRTGINELAAGRKPHSRAWDAVTSLPFVTRAALTAMVTGNFVLLAITIAGFFVSDVGYDWAIYIEAARRVLEGGDLYRWSGSYAWSYSPILAWFFAAVAPIGFLGWSALHIAALGFIRPRWVAAVVFLSWPFWVDLYNGNTMTFVAIAGLSALERRTTGIGAYLLMCLLMPRPVMLPLMIWILWREPAWRARFAVLALASASLALATGQGLAWIGALAGVADAVAESSRDFGPGILFGPWWTAAGALLSVVFMLRGRIGLASLAASPYWLPQYLLMLVLELVRSGPRGQPSGQDQVSDVVEIQPGVAQHRGNR